MNLTVSKSYTAHRKEAFAKAKEKLHADKPRLFSTYVLRVFTGISVLFTVSVLVFLIGYILAKGIPSIVYGLFGYLCFVIALRWEYSMLAGVFTLAIMVLPLIERTSEEALLAVPESYREASFGLGAGKLRTVFRIVLPGAVPGILAGVILAVGRMTGESAALIFTAGTVPSIPKNLFSSARTLSVHLYALISEGLYTNEAYATSLVLLVMVLGINTLSYAIAQKLTKK